MATTDRTKGAARPSHSAKQKEVDLLSERFKKAEIAILAEVRGLTVEKVTQLRADLRKGQAELKVVKNTLAKRALMGTKYESLKDKFKGPVAVAISYGDIVFPARTLDNFQKTEKGLTILAGSMAGKLLTVAEVKELAGLPSLEVSRAQLLGLLLQPASMMARVLDQHAKKQGGGESKAEAKTDEAPAAPAAT